MTNRLSPRPVCGFVLAILFALPAQAQGSPERPSVDELMLELQAEFGRNKKKYAALAKKLDRAVEKALETGTWRGVEGEAAARPMSAHPYLQLVERLVESSHVHVKEQKKTSGRRKELLSEFPWNEQLELVLGLEYGTDRPVPDHENGFIHLGTGPDTLPGYPELLPNQYLFGLGEVVGSRYRVKAKKKFAFEGRTAKDGPRRDEELAAWETIRVYLQGSLPEVPLFAIPQLTHEIHGRLMQRRSEAGEEATRMDRMLALLDSRWNGFTFETPYSKERMALVRPAHALYTDTKGFVSNFKVSQHLAEVGDLPFLSILAHIDYARAFQDIELTSGDLISQNEKARGVLDDFHRDCAYLARYKSLVDEIVRAVLAPHLSYPAYLQIYDFPGGAPPAARESGSQLDKPRAHAILLWAHAGKDPVALADFLHDEVLSLEANRFPGDVSLPNALTQVVREQRDAMAQALAHQLGAEGEAGSPDLQQEFCPHAEHLGGGEVHADYVVHSFTSTHAAAAETIRDAAYAVVLEELGR